jgi:hypothetical protein
MSLEEEFWMKLTMYHDLRHLYWWPNMKQDITKCIAECDICGRVKADHLRTLDFFAAFSCSSLEMGGYFHRFYYGIAPYIKRA